MNTNEMIYKTLRTKMDKEPRYRDKYGKRCHMASVSTVIEAIEKLEEADHYRRFKPLLGFLKALDESEWDDLKVVHFGY